MERTEQNLKDLQVVEDLPTVHAVPYTSSSQKKTSSKKCFRCGKFNHLPSDCRFKNAECFKCSKRGHIATMCMEKGKKPFNSGFGNNRRSAMNHVVLDDTSVTENQPIDDCIPEDENIYSIYTLQHNKVKPFQVIIKLNGLPVPMEIDTGASLTIINEPIFTALQKHDNTIRLQNTSVKFRTYGGNTFEPLGVINLLVHYRQQELKKPIFVVSGNAPCLMGRDFIDIVAVKLFGNILLYCSQFHGKVK